jgi:tetratricopeptide (TPR) repeat protein
LLSALLRFVPVTRLLQKAQTLRHKGEPATALRMTDLALARLTAAAHGGSATRQQAEILKGTLLLELDRRDEALRILLQHHDQLDVEPAAQTAVIAHLLDRGDLTPQAIAAFVRYIGTRGNREPSFERNLARIESLARPSAPTLQRLSAADLRASNTAFAKERPDLAWPHRHLATIDMAGGHYHDAIQSLLRALDAEPEDRRASALLGYAVAMSEQVNQLPPSDFVDGLEDDAHCLLLHGHALRQVGAYAAANVCFARAQRLGPLDQDSAWAFAEAMINCGNPDQARTLLAAHADRDDRRWRLLAAHAAASIADALDLAGPLLADPGFVAPAIRLVLRCLAVAPNSSGGSLLLDTIPESERSPANWSVHALVEFANNAPAAGFANLARAAIEAHDQAIADWIEAALQYHAARLCEQGDWEVLANATAAPAFDELRPIIRGSLIAALCQVAVSRSHDDPATASAMLGLIDAFSARDAALRSEPAVQTVRGHLLALQDQAEAALAAFPSRDHTALDAETQLQLARCALLAGQTELAGSWMAQLDLTNPRAARIAACHALATHQWEVARHHLQTAGIGADALPDPLALRFHLGESMQRAPVEAGDPDAAYYAAAAAFRDGEPEAAARWLMAIPPSHPRRGAADRLLRWQSLRQRMAQQAPPSAAGLAELLNAEALAAEAADPLSVALFAAAATLLPAIIAADHRTLLLGYMTQALAEAGDADAAACHQLAICHFGEAGRATQRGDFPATVEHLGQAIAHIGVALADPHYLRLWTFRRTSAYAVESQIEAGLPQMVIANLQHAMQTLQRLVRDDGAAARIAQAPLLLRAELRGGQMLRKLVEGDPARPAIAIAGPLFMGSRGLARRLADYLAARAVAILEQEDSIEHTLTELRRLIAGDPVPENPARQQLHSVKRLFSCLRIAALLDEEGHPEQALERIRSTTAQRQPFCPLVDCSVPTDGVCHDQLPQFTLCNPAFAGQPDAGNQLRRETAALTLALLLRIGERALARAPEGIDTAIDAWRQAVGIEAAERDAALERIRSLSIATARTLDTRDLEPDGIRLLEAVDALSGDSDVRGQLAQLHASLAIRRANMDPSGGFAEPVAGLRRARVLNPSSILIDRNLIVALLNHAHDIGLERACEMLPFCQEALQIAEHNLVRDPANEEFRKFAEEAQLCVSMASVLSDAR